MEEGGHAWAAEGGGGGGGGKTIAAPVSGRPSRGDNSGAPPQPRRKIRHRRTLASALAQL